VRCALKDAQAGNDALFGELNFSSTLAHLDMAFKELTAAEPWCVCPFCHGLEGCKACKGRGVMGEYRFGQVASKEMKA
jgi:hypothetical protein